MCARADERTPHLGVYRPRVGADAHSGRAPRQHVFCASVLRNPARAGESGAAFEHGSKYVCLPWVLRGCAFFFSGPDCGRQQPPMHVSTRVGPCIAALRERSSLEPMRPKKTILCVDDNEQALSVRKFMLETRGYRVLTAFDCEQALELFREGGIDLVLSDLIMPRMDGNELVRRMKELAPEVPAILISGSVKAFDRANRADAFLPKGCCSPLEMLERIRVMMCRKRGPKKVGGPRAPLPQHEAEHAQLVAAGVS